MPSNIKQTIRAEMAKRKIGIAKLSRMIDCNHGTLYKYFRAKHPTSISVDLFEKITAVLDISVK